MLFALLSLFVLFALIRLVIGAVATFFAWLGRGRKVCELVDENHVEAIPAAGGHLLARGGQEIGIPGPAGREGCPAAAAAGHDCEGGRSPGEKPASQISP